MVSLESFSRNNPDHLAWHETMEIHELVALQSIALMKLKSSVDKIQDGMLRALYLQTIKDLEMNITELIQFYSLAPRNDDEYDRRELGTGFYAGDLLGFAKTAVRTYAAAITETATPALRETLNKHLQKTIQTHGKVFNYMYGKGMYPAYNLEKLLQNDLQNAHKALEMNYK
ncbi:spore coat protein [Virgibacillus ndiopensis]|uniref:spore coat protein n=1 Tax=Virgibacillus ndiopensis TaxID=2004408 RepID=UPI000C0893C9|nr:spore coat protein [Virgibacillus ndiopensis]